MDGLGLLVAIVAFILVLVAFRRIAKLESRIAELRRDLGRSPAAEATPQPVAPIAPPSESGEDAEVVPSNWVSTRQADEPERSDVLPETAEEVSAAPPSPARPPQGPRDMEQALASRWFVWIGGVAIALGGLLFVKYAYDEGLISPLLQIVLGLLAGVALVVAGEVVRRRALTVEEGSVSYVPAALSAAGLAVLFGSIFAAYALYELVAPMTAFVGLALVGFGALALSRWQGPLIAALGLVGSYVTTALIPSADPNAWGFFPYLLVILAASFAVLRGRSWWWLGYAAVAGAAVWSGLWLDGPFEPADLWPLGLFAHAIGLVALFGIRGRAILEEASGDITVPRTLTPPLAIGLAGLAAGVLVLGLLVERTTHAAGALALFTAAMAVLLVLGWLKHGLAALAPLAGLLLAADLLSWPDAAFHALTLDENGIYSWSNSFGPQSAAFLRWMLSSAAVLTLAGIAGPVFGRAPIPWALLGAGAGVVFVVGAWARADFLLGDSSWALIATLAAVALLAGALAAGRRAEGAAASHGAGLLAAGAAALLVFACDRLADGVWLTIAIAVLALAYAAASRMIASALMGPVTVALASLATVRLFLSRELWLDDRTLPFGQHWVLYGYGVPAVLFVAGARLLHRAGHARAATALEGLSLGLFISLVSMELRVLIGGGFLYDEPAFLEVAAHVLAWLGAAYGLMYRQRLYSSIIAMWGARLLIAASVVAIVLFNVLLLNPAVTSDTVPGNIVFNALLLAYLAPIVLIGLIARRLDVIGWQRLKPVAGGLALVLAFVYLTLETKLVFQGKLMVVESLSLAESYAYSAVWLAFAVALFIAGLRLGRQVVRLAGLGVMALVVVKVFGLDMSNLEGLYRIASVVGLGLCLVGIGWLYQRFVQRPRAGRAA